MSTVGIKNSAAKITAAIVLRLICRPARLLSLLHKPQEIVPPQIALPRHAVQILALQLGELLVKSKVQKARVVKYLRNVADEVGADAVVRLR